MQPSNHLSITTRLSWRDAGIIGGPAGGSELEVKAKFLWWDRLARACDGQFGAESGQQAGRQWYLGRTDVSRKPLQSCELLVTSCETRKTKHEPPYIVQTQHEQKLSHDHYCEGEHPLELVCLCQVCQESHDDKQVEE